MKFFKKLRQRKIEKDMLDFIEIYLQGYVSHYPRLVLSRFKNSHNGHVFSINYKKDNGTQAILFQAHYEDGELYFIKSGDKRLSDRRKDLLEYDIKTLAKIYLQDIAKNKKTAFFNDKKRRA